MRKVAILPTEKAGVRSCVLYASPDGVYVFPRLTVGDGGGSGDHWFEDVSAAEQFCFREYGVEARDWTPVPDPLPDCQHDWIRPVRVKGRVDGVPQWGVLEYLGPDGIWRDFDPRGDGDAG
jgi:hypothetical protein